MNVSGVFILNYILYVHLKLLNLDKKIRQVYKSSVSKFSRAKIFKPQVYCTMGYGKRLTDFEKGVISVYAEQKINKSEIAAKTGRSRTVISNYLADKDNYGTKKSSGRPYALESRTKKALIKNARNKSISCRKLKSNLGLECSRRTVNRVLTSPEALKYAKMMGKPPLTDKHKADRVDFAE